MHKRLHSVSLPQEVTAGKWPLLLKLWATEVCPKGPELSHRQGYRRSGGLVCWDSLLPSVAHLCKLYPNLILLRGSWGGFPTGNRLLSYCAFLHLIYPRKNTIDHHCKDMVPNPQEEGWVSQMYSNQGLLKATSLQSYWGWGPWKLVHSGPLCLLYNTLHYEIEPAAWIGCYQ